MKKRAFLSIITAGILWGTSGIFVHVLAPFGFSPLQMTALRGLVSFLCLLVYALLRDRRAFRVKPTELLLFACLGLSLFGTGSCYFASLRLTSISTAVVLMYMAPVYVTVFSLLFFGERFSRLKLVSIAGMLLGCCLVSGVIGGLKFNLGGILLGILSGISYAAYNILTKIAMRRGCSPISTTLYGFLFMSVISLAVCDPKGIVIHVAVNPALTLPWCIALGVVTFVLPYLFFTLAIKELPAGTASALSIVEPLAATVFGIVLFRETLSVFSVCGILLILLSVLLLGRTEVKESKLAIKQERGQPMKKTKKSGPAIFMYCVIAVTALTAAVCFLLYYGNLLPHGALLWTGITAFTVMYHLWLRIIMGNVTKLFPLHYRQRWFRERSFEKKLYRLLRIRKWKEKVLSYDPAAFSVENHTLEEIARAMTKAETDHWINVLISLSTLLFAIPWGVFPIFLVTAVAAILFDAQFIVVQRYNRPLVLRLIDRKKKRAEMC